MLNHRIIAHDSMMITSWLARWFGVLNHKFGAMSIRAETAYYRYTEKERS